MAWMKLGQVGIARAIESNGPFMSIYDFFPDATPEMLAPHRHWLEPAAVEPGTNLLVMPIQSYIIRTPHPAARGVGRQLRWQAQIGAMVSDLGPDERRHLSAGTRGARLAAARY